jgi:transcriptional regulator with XRE-family HTH domain
VPGKCAISGGGYNSRMDQQTIDLASPQAPANIAAIVRNARRLVGWSQAELARRAKSSQSVISRLELGLATEINVLVLNRIFDALGLSARMVLEGRHLRDRERQADGVHAKVNGFGARHMVERSWRTRSEVMIGDDRPRGWIDLLGYREEDRALLVEESKADLPDFGALQRSLAYYEREAPAVARRLGWDPLTVNVLVIALDSVAIARRLADNRDLVNLAFPASISDVLAWLADPAAPRPRGWAFGTCDPASRRSPWLRPTTLGSRRAPPAYANYADAASRLLLPSR